MKKCFVGIGSNLNNPVDQVKTAIAELHFISQTQFLCASNLYLTKPVGPKNQPDFINAVVNLATDLTALELLKALQQIENSHGRERSILWGPRTLDLDLLLYDNETMNTAELILPHPELKKRQFVLQPLAEIAPELNFPCGENIKNLLSTEILVPFALDPCKL